MQRTTLTAVSQILVGKEESPTIRSRIVAAAGGLFGLRVAFSGLSFAASVLLGRLLGETGFGAYSYAFAWIVLIGIFAILGMDQLLVRDVAVYHARSQWGLLRGLLEKATRAVLLASVGIGLLAGITATVLLHGAGRSELMATFWVALLLLPLITLTRVRQSAMQGLHRVALGTVPEQLIQPGFLLLFLLLVYFYPFLRLTAPIAMGANVAGTVLAFAAGTVLLYRTLPREVKESPVQYRDGALVRSALPMLFIAGASVIYGQADTLILGALKGSAAVGIYSVAHKGADFVSFALNVQNTVFASTAASLFALGDQERLQRLVTKLARWTFLASAPLGIGLILFGRWFLYLYGPHFTDARLALAILSFSQLINVGVGNVGLLLVVTGCERDAAAAVCAGAAANILLNFVLVPRWGAEGAAVGYTIGMTLWNVWMAVVLYRKVGIHATVLGRLNLPRKGNTHAQSHGAGPG